jgi:hypothetical protein
MVGITVPSYPPARIAGARRATGCRCRPLQRAYPIRRCDLAGQGTDQLGHLRAAGGQAEVQRALRGQRHMFILGPCTEGARCPFLDFKKPEVQAYNGI